MPLSKHALQKTCSEDFEHITFMLKVSTIGYFPIKCFQNFHTDEESEHILMAAKMSS